MKEEFTAYLETIGISGSINEKIENILNFYTVFIKHEINDIFVTEYITKEGNRVYESLWFFNKNCCYEAKFFMINEDLDSDIIINSVHWFNIKKSDFDIVQNIANENSRMTLRFGLNNEREGNMKSSRENCKYLSMIFKKYIQPNYEAMF